jgi:MoxR-vWA-beta-propeller ternary system domain bpX4
MSSSSEFWQQLFANGRIVFEGPPHGHPPADGDTLSLLERYYHEHALAIAGPSLPFVAEVAAIAARIVELSAWYLVSQTGTPEDLQRDIDIRAKPVGPADHLSADLTLQFLPDIYQRARVLYPADRLPALLGDILRRWPLSGVLADLPDEPLGDLDFGGHHGLLLLYAERLTENFKPAWIPRGLGAPYIELVWAELGQDPALLIHPNPASRSTNGE